MSDLISRSQYGKKLYSINRSPRDKSEIDVLMMSSFISRSHIDIITRSESKVKVKVPYL